MNERGCILKSQIHPAGLESRSKASFFLRVFIPWGALPEGRLLSYQIQNFPQFPLFSSLLLAVNSITNL